MKRIAIVGGGIAGLSAGIFALQSGFEVTIFEMHTIPGGNSTSWKRNGYFFEGGMHWLTGSGKNQSLYPLWCNVGALNDTVSVYNKDPFLTSVYNGQYIDFYRNPEKLRDYLLSISSEDKIAIETFYKDIKKFESLTIPITDIKGVKVKQKNQKSLSSLFKLISLLPRIIKLSKMNIDEYINRFKHPLIKVLLQSVANEGFSSLVLIMTLSTYSRGDGGYPEGGSLGMAQRMAKKFQSLGRKIQYKTKVEKVITKNNIASGVIIDGKEFLSDAVIVTNDALTAIDTFFDKNFKEPWIEKMRTTTIPVINTFIGIGVKADLSRYPESMIFKLDKPITLLNKEIKMIGFNNYAKFSGYAPENCTSLTSIIMGDSYDYWKQKKQDNTYEQEKEKFAQTIISTLENLIPESKGNVCVWDVATPLTYERYCGTYKGSWMSAMPVGHKVNTYPLKSESIQNLYFAGQRMQVPGGLPIALTTARTAVQYLCKDFDYVFQGKI